MKESTMPRPSHTIKMLAYILGFTSMVSQVILLRELVVVFYGNETAYGIILSGWLFWIALGSFTMSRWLKIIQNPARVLLILLWMTNFILPLTVIATRLLRQIIGVPLGEALGILPICISSYLLLAPLTFILGSIFTLLCRLPELYTEKKLSAKLTVGTIYLWEAKGAAVGGLVFSFILVHLMPSLYIIFLVGLVNIYAAMGMVEREDKTFVWSMVLMIILLMVFITGGIAKLDEWTRRVQWKGFKIVNAIDSIYGNIVLTERSGEYNLFENGILSFSTKDELTNEENIHYAMLSSHEPKAVLLVGKGITGGLKEILKYPGTRVDYVELDPAVIEISKNHLPEDILIPLEDPRVKVISSDARLLIKRTPEVYDVVIINLGDPYNAMINRYYTLEFFKEVKRILTSQGILSLNVTSSENYLNREARAFLQSIHSTLAQVFPSVVAIPGDSNIFLACPQKDVLTVDAKILIERLKSQNIKTRYVSENYLPNKLSKDRLDYIDGILKTKGAINTDAHPVTYLYNTLFWSTRFNLGFKKIIESLAWIQLRHLMLIPVLILIVGLLLRNRIPSFALTASIVSTGLSQIIFQLIVILAFQSLYGFAYYKIGLILSSFMVGLALGSFWAQKIIERPLKDLLRLYKLSQGVISVYPLILPGLFVIFRNVTSLQSLTFFATAFAFLPIAAGFIGGLQYPLATRLISSLQKKGEKETATTAGGLYAADTFGATLGALLTGTLLIPLLGIEAVAYWCAGINFAVFILLMVSFYPAKSSERV